jgi:hypothetical protein
VLFYNLYLENMDSFEGRRNARVDKLEMKLKIFELRLKHLEDVVLESIVKMNDIKEDNDEVRELSKSLSEKSMKIHIDNF